MQTTEESSAMDFDPNLFAGGNESQDGSANDQSTPATDVVTDQSDSLTTNQDPGHSNELPAVAPAGDTSANQAQNLDQSQKTGKTAFGSDALSTSKAAVKLFETINGYDEQSATQRNVVRELMAKQTAAMELKLKGEKSPAGEDFDSISKQLRRENNRLDTLLEGKEALFEKARNATQQAIEKLQALASEITRMEEEG